MNDAIQVTHELRIPAAELEFRASRSSGPGGQHVNKVSSRVTLRFDVAGSPSLSDDEKRSIAAALRTRMTRRGVLQLHCQRSRSQAANRRELVVRFVRLLEEALRERTPRKVTSTPAAVRESRLREKRRRAALKRDRRPPSRDED